MFTGLIEETGSVLWIRATDHGTQLQLSAPRIAGDVHTGDSISVNGCCLTVASHRHEQVTFDLLEETVARTNLGALKRRQRGQSRARSCRRCTPRRTFRAGSHRLHRQHYRFCRIRFSPRDRLARRSRAVCGRKGIDRSQRDQLNHCRSEAGKLCHLDHSAYPSLHQLKKRSSRATW